MIESVKFSLNPKEEQDSKNVSSNNININGILNSNGEEEKNLNIKEQEETNSEDEKLGFKSNYTLNKNNIFDKDNKKTEELALNSKISSNSTVISQNEVHLEQVSSLYPINLKKESNDRENNYNSYSSFNFNRERLYSTPITNYFQGIDYYLRGIQPEKNDYSKSGNYIEKEKFFKDKDFSYRFMKYKSFDLSEQKKFVSNQAFKKSEDNNILIDNNMNNFPQNKPTQINIENKIQNSTINNINIINNQPMIMQMPQNFESGIGKFDMPMYCVRYCDIDCKINN